VFSDERSASRALSPGVIAAPTARATRRAMSVWMSKMLRDEVDEEPDPDHRENPLEQSA
jgi:hypothetical protein